MDDKATQIEILQKFQEQMSSTWDSKYAEEFRQCLLFVNDLKVWSDVLTHFPQTLLFKSSLNECATANLLCSQGLYKHAMISLRLCLEHCLYAIQLSTNDFYFRKWKSGNADMNWAAIIDRSSGIFSKEFINAYAPEFEDRSTELINITSTVYRECSEFIHGNYDKLNCLPAQSEFNQEMLSQYISRFQSISYILSVVLVIRFKEYILEAGILPTLEGPIMNNVDMLPEIQLLYNKTGEAT